MMIAGRIKRVAFYCRMNPRNNDYTQFLKPIKVRLDDHYGKAGWEMIMFFDIASGAEPKRTEFLRLQDEINAGLWDVVITRRATMLARDWRQFMGFMDVCNRCHVEVLSLDENEDAAKQYQCISRFGRRFSALDLQGGEGNGDS